MFKCRYFHFTVAIISFLFVNLLLTSATSHQLDTQSSGKNGSSPKKTMTYTDILKRDLLTHYDKFARPAQHNNVTSVDFDLVLIHIDLDIAKSLMTVNGWLKLVWVDEKLKWNTSNYGGLNKLHVGDHEIWEPDILLYNGAVGNNIDHYGNSNALIFPDGVVIWVPPSRFMVHCSLDLFRYPYDRHTCTLQIGTWTYGHDMVHLTVNKSSPVELILDTEYWKVLSVDKKVALRDYECCSKGTTVKTWYAQFDITIERGYSSYTPLIFLPAIGVMVLCLSVFWMPAECWSSKVVVSSCTALIVALLLLHYSSKLGPLGPTTPLIIIYYALSMLLVCISLIVSMVSYNLATDRSSPVASRIISTLINSNFSVLVILPKYQKWSSNAEDSRDGWTLDEDRQDTGFATVENGGISTSLVNCYHVATALNRLAFFTYLLIYIGFGLKYLL